MLGCKTVQPGDVVETWAMTDSARHELPLELQKASGKLVVNPDGTFSATELPEELDASNAKPHVRLDSGDGSWTLAHFDGGQNIELEFHKLESDEPLNREPYGFPLDITRSWSAWELCYFLGDPDQARRVTLVRR
jgi:hypothetical protein